MERWTNQKARKGRFNLHKDLIDRGGNLRKGGYDIGVILLTLYRGNNNKA